MQKEAKQLGQLAIRFAIFNSYLITLYNFLVKQGNGNPLPLINSSGQNGNRLAFFMLYILKGALSKISSASLFKYRPP